MFQSKRLTLSNYFEKTEFAAQVLQHKIFTSDYSNAYEIDISNATMGAISSGGKGQRFESSRARHFHVNRFKELNGLKLPYFTNLVQHVSRKYIPEYDAKESHLAASQIKTN